MEKENGLGESVSVVVGGEVRVVVVVNGTEWVGMGVEKEKREKGKENGSEGKGESHVGECVKRKRENKPTNEEAMCHLQDTVCCLGVCYL